MRALLLRILKHGLPTAGLLALIGYGMAELSAMYLAMQPGAGRDGGQWAENMANAFRFQVPVTMAAFGFALVALLEFLYWLVHGNPASDPAPPRHSPPPDPTDQLLEDLLRRSEADLAGRDRQSAE